MTTAMVTEPMLARPVQVRGVRFRNRIVGAPMERNYCDRSGTVTPRYVDYLARRAAGGAGLLFTESCYIAQEGKARNLQMGLHGEHVIDDLARLADAVHAEGALLGVELNHGGRVVPSAVSQQQPVAPSAIPCAEIGGEMPRALSATEIAEIVAKFALAARRAVDAGVDVLAVHGAHGYLIGQFLSPRSNHRGDEYGKKTAFLNEVLAAVRGEVGDAVPISLRLSAFEGLPGGLDEDASLALAGEMSLDLVDVVDLSAGTYGAGHWITPSGEVEEGYLASVASRYRAPGRLVGVAGRITTREAAERVLGESADLVVVGRALHADPDWSQHVISGTQLRPCISCNQGCADVIHQGLALWCAVNPATGHEIRSPVPSRSRDRSERRIVVIGGGPGGLEAARTAASAGFGVRLVERADQLGGQFALAARLKSKPQFRRLVDWYEQQLADLDVDLALGRDVSGADVESAAAIVVATGGVGLVPPVPGSELDRVTDIRTWLERHLSDSVPAATIWGADRAALFVADDLAARGCRVTVVSAETELARDAGGREKQPAMERLAASENVRVELGVAIERITEDAVIGIRAGEEKVVVPQTGPVLASHGTVPAPVPAPVSEFGRDAACVVGEAAGASTFDEAISTAHRETARVCELVRGDVESAR